MATTDSTGGTESTEKFRDVRFIGIHEGMQFTDAETMELVIRNVQDTSFVELYKRSSRSISSVKKMTPVIYNKVRQHGESKMDELKYYEVTYTCKFGGRKFKSKRKNETRASSTYRNNCQAEIKICLSTDCSKLEVRNINEQHCHDVSEELYKHLPRQRQISAEHLKEADKLLKLKVSTRKLREHLQHISGNIITSRDIQNIIVKLTLTDRMQEVAKLITNLTELPGTFVRAFHKAGNNSNNKANVLQAILFQDKQMREIYHAYPEILIVDSTYNANRCGMHLFILTCVDGNNNTQIAGIFFTISVSAASLLPILQAFKEGNSAWINTSVVITDLDVTERKVVADLFPQAKLQLCLWHVLRTFNTEITVEEMGLNAEDLEYALTLLMEMAHSQCTKDFNDFYEQFSAVDSQPLQNYFCQNWYNIKEQWACAYKLQQHNMGELTTNRLETLNQRIKDVTGSFNSLTEFFSDFLDVLKTLRETMDHDFIASVNNESLIDSGSTFDVIAYKSILTPYAFQVVEQEIFNSTVNTIPSIYITTPELCNCPFQQSNSLPCRHIFKLRKEIGLPLYSSKLIPKRWTKQYHFDAHRCNLAAGSRKTTHTMLMERQTSNTPAPNERYNKIMDIARSLAGMASSMSTEKYRILESNLKQIQQMTRNDQLDNLNSPGINSTSLAIPEAELYDDLDTFMTNEETPASTNTVHGPCIDHNYHVPNCDTSLPNSQTIVPVHYYNRDQFQTDIANMVMPPKGKMNDRPTDTATTDTATTAIGPPKKPRKKRAKRDRGGSSKPAKKRRSTKFTSHSQLPGSKTSDKVHLTTPNVLTHPGNEIIDSNDVPLNVSWETGIEFP